MNVINRQSLLEAIQLLGRLLPRVAGQFGAKQCQQNAAALTYMTLFAIVPLMTVSYSMFSVIPAFQGVGEQLQDMIFTNFVPSSGLEVQQYLQEFSGQARNLTVVGVAMLVVTAYLMLKNIETAFNTIWGVQESRKGLSNFLLYWAVLSLGPLLLGVGLVMSTYLLSLRLFVDEYDKLGLLVWLLRYLPWLLTAAMFTLLYAAVPNCRVPVRAAAIGGALTALVFELVKGLFGWIVSHTSFEVIYGAFAVVPLFLLWINLLWMIVLAGAVLVRTLSSYQSSLMGRDYPDLVAAVLILWQFYVGQARGEGLDDQQLVRFGVTTEQWQRLRGLFLRQRLLTATQRGDYVLCRDLHGLTLFQLSQLLQLPTQMSVQWQELQQFEWSSTLEEHLSAVDQYRQQQFSPSLAELFAGSELACPRDLKATTSLFDAPLQTSSTQALSAHGEKSE